MLYDELLLVFCDTIFIFVIIFRAKSSSLSTSDENGDFVLEDIPFCDESEQRHEQIVTYSNFSSSGWMMRMGVPKGEKLGGHHKFALI
jgi:hypothetical protein